MTQFSLSRVVTTGLVQPDLAPAVHDGAPRPKMRKLSEILLEVPRPRPQVKRQQLPETSDVQVCIYKITDDARIIWDDVKESDYALWQVQVQHQAQDDITVNIYNSFNEFLKTQESAEIPEASLNCNRKPS